MGSTQCREPYVEPSPSKRQPIDPFGQPGPLERAVRIAPHLDPHASAAVDGAGSGRAVLMASAGRTIEPGSLVRVRSGGGPTMAVGRVETPDGGGRPYARCSWVDEKGAIRFVSIDVDALELLRRPEEFD